MSKIAGIFVVIEAGSAEEALQLLNGKGRTDLLFTNHPLPRMNGTDLARVVRSASPDVRVLIVSGCAEMEGVDADLPCLNKPFATLT